MYRIIFSSLKDGYEVFDSTDAKVIAHEQDSEQRQGCKIICIVDYNARSYMFKCSDFDGYADDVDDLVFGSEHYIEIVH